MNSSQTSKLDPATDQGLQTDGVVEVDTHTEEFYRSHSLLHGNEKLTRELRHWEKIYTTVRPHQALGYLTPLQLLRKIASPRKE
ncbi:MAG: integrase core domain-containing protein [Candidatus Sulfotelmatobacter sp.]